MSGSDKRLMKCRGKADPVHLSEQSSNKTAQMAQRRYVSAGSGPHNVRHNPKVYSELRRHGSALVSMNNQSLVGNSGKENVNTLFHWSEMLTL